MNIAIISYFFNDHHAEVIVTAKLARALAEAGHSVSVFGNLIGTQEIIDKSKQNEERNINILLILVFIF